MTKQQTHKCAVRGCQEQIGMHLLMCAPHWDFVPSALAGRVYETYRAWKRGTGAMDAWVLATKEARTLVEQRLGEIAGAKAAASPESPTAEISEYSGPEDRLFSVLQAEAIERRGTWARRVLRRGTVVSMQVSVAGVMRVTLSRTQRPVTLFEQSRWQGEIVGLTRQLGIGHFLRLDDRVEGEAVHVRFTLSPRAG